jgi:hypothetical protein
MATRFDRITGSQLSDERHVHLRRKAIAMAMRTGK